ncbi:MAG: sugar isomerase, partial [Oscillospiraceae bacterium]|nr:sugar isomerase [Oscillospiraceae bacterium]
IAILFGISSLFRSLRITSSTLVEAAGKFKENKWANIIEAIANVVLSVVFVIFWGVPGILLASAVTGITRSVGYIYYSSKEILGGFFWQRLLKNAANFSLLMIIWLLASHLDLSCNGFMSWFLLAVPIGLVCLLLFFVLNSLLDRDSGKDVFERFKNIF